MGGTLLDRGRKVMIAVDDSAASCKALTWATEVVLRRVSDEVHLVTVLPPNASPTNLDAKTSDVLKRAVELVVQEREHKIPKENVHTHALPAAGGASGVAESLVEFAKAARPDVVILGSRGMGSLKRSLMSFIGLGSVSDFCLHHMAPPVVVVKQDDRTGPPSSHQEASPAAPGQPSRRICVACDESPQSDRALQWTLDNLLGPHDRLHLVTVALPVPQPLLDEDAAVLAAENMEVHREEATSRDHAQKLCNKAADAAVQYGLIRTKLTTQVLVPEGGVSDIGDALCRYAKAKEIGVMVMGSRGLGTLQRSLMGFMGLGSVSDYCAHNLPCPVVVIKEEVPQHADSSACRPITEEMGEEEGGSGPQAEGLLADLASSPGGRTSASPGAMNWDYDGSRPQTMEKP